ncbi:MAG: trypsin-like peptidase domain-containing protein [Candidatus Caldarchaeum sp.]|uniref:PDZ domain-containing protein n=1 Tax=Caldiarchaeum subterraneum TaxID=311458 RepID=A0A7C5QN76_CALS0
MASKSSLFAAAVMAVLLAFNAYQLYLVQSENQQLRQIISSLAARAESMPATVVHETTTVLSVVTGRVSNYTAIYEMVKDSVVMIRVLGQVGSAVGSGFVYDTEGHIVTNNHVVGGGRVFRVVFSDGSMFTAKVVGTDVDSDLAVLKIENPPQGLKPLKLGDSSALKIGEEVIAIGNPFGLEGTLTTGVVSQKGRLLPTGRGFSIPGVIQTDAAINPGNSGGPLLNLRGEVVGVNTAIEPSGVGIGYAVPSSIVARVVPELIQKGSYKRSWMGISATTLDMDIAAAMGAKVQKGVLIVDVTANGPAHKAGLRGGDRNVVVNGVPVRVGGDIITAVDGTPVNSMDDFLLYMEEKTSPGQTITLTIFRGGETLNIQVTLGVRP